MLDKKSEEIVDNNEYVKEGVDTQKFLEIVTNKFNEKYSNLTEEEKNILKVLREDNKEGGKKIVSSLVKETISILNTKIDSHKNNIDIKEKLLETKDTVYSMLENEGDLNNNILKLYDLKNNLKDE
jgi:LytS/YehU family sensor histidine kinase